MKCFLKVIVTIISTLAVLKAIQVGIDYLYCNYGKKYISTDEIS